MCFLTLIGGIHGLLFHKLLSNFPFITGIVKRGNGSREFVKLLSSCSAIAFFAAFLADCQEWVSNVMNLAVIRLFSFLCRKCIIVYYCFTCS